MQERIPDELTLPELTLRGLILGALITVVFTASNVYLGLKVGLTFASSIPAAVISMAVLRYFSGANILENNMVQTQASAAGTLSSIIFILPGLLMIGYWSGFPFWQTAAICSIGGILGVLYTIPLRRVMVVQSELPYPEGVAAAEILRVGSDGAEDEEDARAPRAAGNAPGLYDILGGGLVAALFSLWSSGFKVLAEGFSVWLSAGQAAFRLSTGFSLALVGAGYLMGITAGIAILIGVVISWGVAVPLLTVNSVPADGQSLSDLATQLWSSQVRFLGAGTIGVAALWTLATLFKPMVRGVWASLGAVRGNSQANSLRTELDMPAKWILLIAGILLVSLFVVFSHFLGAAAPDMASPQFWSLVAVCVVFAFFFGFLIAAACGYMAGLVGSSSSPISGIGIIAVILVSLLILGFGSIEGGLLDRQNGKLAIALALFTTSVVLAIAAISNDNLQDLKTGYLVGATPWRQQVALIVGCIVGALVIPPGAGTALQRLRLHRGPAARGNGPRPGPGRAAGDPDDGDRQRDFPRRAELEHDPHRRRPGHRPDPRRPAPAPYRQGLPAGAGGGPGDLPAADHRHDPGGRCADFLAAGKCPEEACGGGRGRRRGLCRRAEATRRAAGFGADRRREPDGHPARRGDRRHRRGRAAGAGRRRLRGHRPVAGTGGIRRDLRAVLPASAGALRDSQLHGDGMLPLASFPAVRDGG